MILLKDILFGVSIISISGNTSSTIKEIRFDSRRISTGDLFIAIKGVKIDGHKFINQAIANGANTIIHENEIYSKENGVNYVHVENSKKALAIIASNFYNQPSKNLQLIGVTGTNGKTTVATLLFSLFKSAGYKVGLISTIKIIVHDNIYNTNHTTPDPITINHYLDEMSRIGVEFCFMEVSSHGIDQLRTEALLFKGGIFTNLSHDHLDYHNSFKDYRDVKKSFFDNLPKTAFALFNSDDRNGHFMVQNTKAKVYSYALKSNADYKVKVIENQFTGLLLKINNYEIWVKLVGVFNAYNVAAIFACADILNLEYEELLRLISELDSVTGRFDFYVSNSNISIIVDYAHTPDALKNVLQTINNIRSGNENIITVFGCGGERDKEKRPKMGEIASTLSTTVILTNDNPRSENPDIIISEIQNGVDPKYFNKIILIKDRKEAIRTAGKLAKDGDIILIAGKGHEDYQEICGKKEYFSDIEVVKQYLIEL